MGINIVHFTGCPPDQLKTMAEENASFLSKLNADEPIMEEWKLEPARDIGLPLGERFRSVRREPGLVDWSTHLMTLSVFRIALAVLHRLKIEGKEHLPAAGPFVLVSNHSSHLDALVLTSALPWKLRPHVFPIAAGDTFFDTPLTAAMSAVFLNAVPMWRKHAGSHSLIEMRQKLIEEKCLYVVFPEGTRSRTGEMGPFKAGLGMIVAGTPAPVIPCRLWGSFESWKPHQRFPRPHRIRLKIGPGMMFENASNDREGWNAIASDAEAAVRSLV
jgi:1-acyl-sn-glycerol-3-phosphate acyltransferase